MTTGLNYLYVGILSKQENGPIGGKNDDLTNEKSGNMPSYFLVWANMPSGVNMPSNVPHIL